MYGSSQIIARNFFFNQIIRKIGLHFPNVYHYE